MAVLALTDLEMDLWMERSAIMEYDAGMNRFEAEAKAAENMGRKRWEFINANSERNSGGGGDNGSSASRDAADGLPSVQRAQKEEN